MAFSLLSLLLLFSVAVLIGADDDDRVTSIPGYDGCICWEHYAGYLNASDDHQLYYWYHEATSSPSDKPLVVWLNGGPGCSSLGGMFTELGPFVLDENLNITLNPFSFNRAANLLFVEQPAGVGFSYPNVPANDSSTATDTVLALRHFLKTKHPELQGRPLYVMGESYGGHYVPNTVKEIQVTNAALKNDESSTQKINIQGFAVGNGYTDWELDFNANVENGRYHALTSQRRFDQAQMACQGEYARCFWPREDVPCPEECADAVHAATVDAMDGSIDIYDIYEDVCLHDKRSSSSSSRATQITTFLSHRQKALERYYLSKMNKKDAVVLEETLTNGATTTSSSRHRSLHTAISPIFPTCIDDYTAKYLNSPNVQEAIHVRPNTIPNGAWADCGNVEYDFNYESELKNYEEWIEEGELEILIYNGDADYILSHMGNSAWITQGLNLTSSDREWTKWHGSDGQVAGYFETYQTKGGIPFTFLTVKGAGHMVPKDRPEHALNMLVQFLKGGQDYDKVERATVTPLCPGL
mmetsp:Transcript_22639/g.34204  ORF Transcript_22639/g.34204 Transcript_22639/m.34204 type:complete len:526 (-) Transcript_22639:87-1664(-)